MPETELTKLRRARIRCHKKLKQTEALLAGYQAKLADLESKIRAICPELDLPLRTRKPNPIFKHGELSQMALAVLREAGEPLPIRVITVRMLAKKGIILPDPAMRFAVRKRVRVAFCALDRRGVTVVIGGGREAVRWLSAKFIPTI